MKQKGGVERQQPQQLEYLFKKRLGLLLSQQNLPRIRSFMAVTPKRGATSKVTYLLSTCCITTTKSTW